MSFYRVRFLDIDNEDISLLEAADFAAHLPQDKTSAVFRDMHPDEWMWGISEHLQAVIADVGLWLQWSKTKDGQRKSPRNKPKPIKRPGGRKQDRKKDNREASQVQDAVAVPIDELKQRLSPL